jgi:hypothetical protein
MFYEIKILYKKGKEESFKTKYYDYVASNGNIFFEIKKMFFKKRINFRKIKNIFIEMDSFYFDKKVSFDRIKLNSLNIDKNIVDYRGCNNISNFINIIFREKKYYNYEAVIYFKDKKYEKWEGKFSSYDWDCVHENNSNECARDVLYFIMHYYPLSGNIKIDTNKINKLIIKSRYKKYKVITDKDFFNIKERIRHKNITTIKDNYLLDEEDCLYCFDWPSKDKDYFKKNEGEVNISLCKI